MDVLYPSTKWIISTKTQIGLINVSTVFPEQLSTFQNLHSINHSDLFTDILVKNSQMRRGRNLVAG